MPRPKISKELRSVVAERANFCCEYCRSLSRYSTQPFSIDHITPRSRGGTNTLDQLAYSCQGCNNHKYNKITGYDPVLKQQVPLYNPRSSLWSEHFTWGSDFTMIVGITATGRATIHELQLNRLEVKNLRRVLLLVGDHPPTE